LKFEISDWSFINGKSKIDNRQSKIEAPLLTRGFLPLFSRNKKASKKPASKLLNEDGI